VPAAVTVTVLPLIETALLVEVAPEPVSVTAATADSLHT
jgi:hypothetical protein